MVTHNKLIENGIFAIALLLPQVLSGETFAAKTVLEWTHDAQDSYFNTSVGMTAIVAAQTGQHGAIADCINNWYWDEAGAKPEVNDELRNVFGRLPDFHPQALILALVEKNCGAFRAD